MRVPHLLNVGKKCQVWQLKSKSLRLKKMALFVVYVYILFMVLMV